MSFTSDTKKELTTLTAGKKCCQLAQITGFLKYAGSVTLLAGGKVGLKVTTDNPAVARLFVTLIKDYFGSKSSLTITEPGQLRGRLYELSITPEHNSEAILRETGIISVKEGYNVFPETLKSEIVRKRCCRKAALRGVFLASGSVSDPARGSGYHMEMVFDSEEKAKDVAKLINSFGLKAKIAKRRNRYIAYIKDGEQIEDFLSVIGVTGQLFKFQDVRIKKEMRNTANRQINCDTANLEKTISAAQQQISDIEYIKNVKTLNYLNGKLRETAMLRLQFPEMPLSELCLQFDPPLTKSGLNNRLKKIAETADKLRQLGY